MEQEKTLIDRQVTNIVLEKRIFEWVKHFTPVITSLLATKFLRFEVALPLALFSAQISLSMQWYKEKIDRKKSIWEKWFPELLWEDSASVLGARFPSRESFKESIDPRDREGARKIIVPSLFRSMKQFHANLKIRHTLQTDVNLDKHLRGFGSARVSDLAKAILETVPTRYNLGYFIDEAKESSFFIPKAADIDELRQDEARRIFWVAYDNKANKWYKPIKGSDKECIVEDFVHLVWIDNPLNTSKKLLQVMGCHGAATQWGDFILSDYDYLREFDRVMMEQRIKEKQNFEALIGFKFAEHKYRSPVPRRKIKDIDIIAVNPL